MMCYVLYSVLSREVNILSERENPERAPRCVFVAYKSEPVIAVL